MIWWSCWSNILTATIRVIPTTSCLVWPYPPKYIQSNSSWYVPHQTTSNQILPGTYPTTLHPIKFFLVGNSLKFIRSNLLKINGKYYDLKVRYFRLQLQKENTAKEIVEFSPSFEEVKSVLDTIVDTMVISVQDIHRVEINLFQQISDLDISFISSVSVNEEIIHLAKQRIQRIVDVNSTGPTT